MRSAPTHLSASALAGLPGMPVTARGVRMLARRHGWSCRELRGNGGTAYHYDVRCLPAETQRALARASAATTPAPVPELNYGKLRDHQQARGVAAVHAVERFHELVAEGHSKHDAEHQVSREWSGDEKHRPSPRTVRHWVKQCRHHPKGKWFALLVPNYKAGGRPAECHPDAWSGFIDRYKSPSKPAVKVVYRQMKAAMKLRGIEPVPSLSYFRRRLAKVPTLELMMEREGEKAVDRALPTQRRSVEDMFAMDTWGADGHLFDVVVRFPDGTVARPMAVAFQDIASRKFLSFRVDKSENSTLIRLAFADAVENCGDLVPDEIRVDCGRAFWSDEIAGGVPFRFRGHVHDAQPKGLFPKLEIAYRSTRPAHGQAKPIERAFGDFCENFSKSSAFVGAYTGNSPTTKPENYGKRAVPYEEFVERLKYAVDEHNNREGREAGKCNGRSFNKVFEDDLKQRPQMPRTLTTEQKRWLYLEAKTKKVHKGTSQIHFEGNRYWSLALTELQGQDVRIHVDPDNFKRGIYVSRMNGEFVTFAECRDDTGHNDRTASREHERSRSKIKKGIRTVNAERRKLGHQELAEEDLMVARGVYDGGAKPSVRKTKPKVLRPAFGVPKPPPLEIPGDAERRAEERAKEQRNNAMLLELRRVAEAEMNERLGRTGES